MERAKEYHKRALGIRLKKLGPEHATVERSRLELDNVQPASDDLQNGREHQEPYFERNHEQRKCFVIS